MLFWVDILNNSSEDNIVKLASIFQQCHVRRSSSAPVWLENLCINCFNKILAFKTKIGSRCWERSKKKALHSCTVYTKLTALGLCDFRLFSYEHIKLHLNSIELRNTNSSYWNLRTSSMIKLKLKLFSRSDRFRNTICLSRQKIIVEETCYFFNQATKMSSHAPWVGNQQWTLATSQKILVKFSNWTFVHTYKIPCEKGYKC